MVKIRLQRVGTKKRAYYRIVALDEREKRSGRPLQYLGTYDPLTQPPVIKLDAEGVAAWQSKGAQLSDTVRSLVKQQAAAAAGAS